MAKVPFGGFGEDEPIIDKHCDPTPLLAEIAQCAYDGLPMRPQLAAWFYYKWKAGKVEVKRSPGTPCKDDPAKVGEALCQLMEYGSGKPGVEEAIRTVRKQLSLKSNSKTIYGWLREIRAVELEERNHERAQQEQLALETYRELTRQGIGGIAARRRVYDTLHGACKPTEQALLDWQWQVERESQPE